MSNSVYQAGRKTYNMVDVFKLFAAILVVLIHVNESHDNHTLNLLDFSITPIAVPFFFMVSGFLFQKGMDYAENKTKKVKTFVLNTLFLYVAWQLITLFETIQVYSPLYGDKGILYNVAIYFRRIFVCGNGAYWYLLVLAEAIAVIYLISRLKKCKKPILIGLIIIGLILKTVYDNAQNVALFNQGILGYINHLFYVVFSWSNNCIMMGIPFVGIGVLCAKHEKMECINKPAILIVLPAVFVGATIINIVMFQKGVEFKILYIFQAFAFYLLSLILSQKVNISSKVSLSMREMSYVIYFLHTIVIYELINRTIGINAHPIWRIAIAVAVPVVAYVLIKWILKYHDIKILRFLFNIKKQTIVRK